MLHRLPPITPPPALSLEVKSSHDSCSCTIVFESNSMLECEHRESTLSRRATHTKKDTSTETSNAGARHWQCSGLLPRPTVIHITAVKTKHRSDHVHVPAEDHVLPAHRAQRLGSGQQAVGTAPAGRAPPSKVKGCMLQCRPPAVPKLPLHSSVPTARHVAAWNVDGRALLFPAHHTRCVLVLLIWGSCCQWRW